MTRRNEAMGRHATSVVARAFLVAVLIASAAGCASRGAPGNDRSAVPAAASATSAVEGAVGTSAVGPGRDLLRPTFGDGTWRVGIDVTPATYRLRASPAHCYWARLKGFTGATNDILANGNEEDPAVITIGKSDKGFRSEGCGTWSSDLSALTSLRSTFSGGTWIVGTDVAPGTYRTNGGADCYWARLSGFGGMSDNVIANDTTSGPAVVTIRASDKGFQSSGCDTWRRG